MASCLEAEVVENRAYANDNYLLALEAPEVASRVEPGQFVMAAPSRGAAVPSPLLKRAMAVYSVRPGPRGPCIITLLLKVIGPGTRGLARVQPGERVDLIGPLGRGFDLNEAARRTTLLVAGGIGIASLLLAAERLAARDTDVRLLYGARSGDDLVGLEDFEGLGLPVIITTDDGSRGMRGTVLDGLEQFLSRNPECEPLILCCGPNPMMQAVSRFAADRGLPCRISVEAKMACGFGVCLGCSVKTINCYRLACREGPVFDAAEFVWEEL